MTNNERRLFNHLLRMVSVLAILQIDCEQGHSAVSLPANLRAARQYLLLHCPALLDFVDRCYRNQPIPDSLLLQAQQQLLTDEITSP